MTDGLIINGARYPVPCVRVVTWEDDPRVPKAVHGAPRDSADVTGSVVHTSRGKRYSVTRDTGSPAKGLRVARYLGRRNSRQVSAHFVVAGDGTVYQIADCGNWRTNNAGTANGFICGGEVSQDDDDPSLTQAQVAAFVATMHVIHDVLRIPKRVPMVGGRHVIEDVKAWLSRKSGGEQRAFSGCAGHRNTSASRGEGDPGDPLMEALRASGFAGATPAEMTIGPNTARVTAEDEADEMHDGDDAPAWPPLPAWLDPSREIDATSDLPDDLAAFARAHAPVLAGLGVTGDHAAELIAHAATECGRGRRAIGCNYFGRKLRRDESDDHRAKYGVGLGWWRDFGHAESGDDEVEYYRTFDGPADAWQWFAKRHLGTVSAPPTSDRYLATGRAFWSDHPEAWIVEAIRAGYRGTVRAAEIAALRIPSTHPSVVAHRRLVHAVKGLLT